MINFNFIDRSIKFFEDSGFSRIETPWTVTKEISNITKPSNAKDFELLHDNNKCLVASAEQSFLYLYNKGFLPKGKFQSVTPCFRFENFDQTHTKYFLKNELIITDDTSIGNLNWIVSIAYINFCILVDPYGLREYVEVVPLDGDCYDINLGKTEIGSYGIRECSFLKWIYGTGIAEPRLSKAIEIKKYELS